MSTMVRIAWHEAARRRNALVAGVAAAVLAAMAPLVPSLERWASGEVTVTASLFLAAALAAVLAVTAGSSVLASDLAGGRLGFYLSRPVPEASLWAGKLVGAWMAVVAAGAMAALPAVVVVAAGGSRLVSGEALLTMVGWGATGALALLAAAHVLGVMARSRSPWLVLDLAALLAVTALCLWGVRTLAPTGAERPLRVALWALMGVGFAAALAAGMAGTIRGRTGLTATHRALSATFWTILAAGVLLFAGYARWFVSVSPADLTALYAVDAAPSGSWAVVGGRAAGRPGWEPSFLVNLSDAGSFTRTGGPAPAVTAAFSADGSRAAWLEADGGHASAARLMSRDLTRPGDAPTGTALAVGHPFRTRLVLSADGSRLADVAAGGVSVYALPGWRLLAAARLPVAGGRWWGAFDGGTLRLVGVVPAPAGRPEETAELVVAALDPAARRLEVTGRSRLDGPYRPAVAVLDGPGRRFVLLGLGGEQRRCTLRDLLTGASLATLGEGRGSGLAAFLADGRVVAVTGARSGRELSVLDRDGALLRRVPLGGATWVVLGGELQPGRLVVARTPPGKAWGEWDTVAIDVNTGDTKVLGRGLVPVASQLSAQRPAPPAPGSLATRLFVDGARTRLLRFDPATGATTVLLGRP